jgi:thiamine biosynthesis lipoprotein
VLHWLLALSLSAVALGGRAEPDLRRYEAVEPHMGTLVRITLYAPDEHNARSAFRAAFNRIRELDDILSDYRPDSELTRITQTAVGRAMPVSQDLFAVLAASQELAEATNGAFDITQGPVIRLWREARKSGRHPGAAILHEAANRSGFRKLQLDASRRSVSFDIAGMALDAGAIGKGYAASEAIEVLGALGIRSALVAVSGDLAFSDAPPGHRGWRISVVPDASTDGSVPRVLELSNAAVSTSGSSEQHVDIGGRRYSHIVDPSTRSGVMDDITVTVVARNGLDADGLDTAVSVLGTSRGLAFIESQAGAAALVVERSSTGEPRALPSSRFRALIAQQNARMPERRLAY